MIRRSLGQSALLGCFVVFAALAFARPAAAQGGVSGTILDGQNKPIEGASITLEAVDNGRKFNTKTDSKGEFFQIGLIKGSYRLTVEKGGVKAEQLVTVEASNRVTKMRPLALTAGGNAPGGAAAALRKLFDEGAAAEKAGNHDEAIAKYTEAAGMSPKCDQCYTGIGIAQAGKKDYAAAEASFKKALEVKPDSSEAYAGLANIYNAQRKFDEAAAASAKATELAGAGGGLAGGNPDAMYNQGVILWNSGKVADAKKQFEAVIAANPNHAEAHYQLGMALVNEGNLKGAGAEFETYLKLAPTGPNAAQAKALAAQLPK
jgi:tetratricopeptide (TPR) repeat protein